MKKTQKTKNPNSTFVCLGEIVGVHGVRGGVHVRSFASDAKDLGSYGILYDEAGQRQFQLTHLSAPKKASKKSEAALLVAHFAGIDDRDMAQALRGTRLYIERSQLPPHQNKDFYHADLIGLEGRDTAGHSLGQIMGVHNFGAGDILEVGAQMIPFTTAHVPEVNIAAGFVIISSEALELETLEEESKSE
ncbi:MAG: 16S rRNA processing protein RimM [Alphaproteobacteria bacterium]|nr:16S rRNA processing protein RimM [Alphaproteobacteria bacterium]